MGSTPSQDYLFGLVRELAKQASETEWLERKRNNADPREIGEYISALSNAAALVGKPSAFMAWGIDDTSRQIVGTDFDPRSAKKGNEELESWLLRLLEPKLDFRFHDVIFENDLRVVLLEIDAATRHPVRFEGQEWLRVGSYKKKLKDFPASPPNL